MRIDVIPIAGSATGVVPSDIESPGVGGSELMLLRWSREMTRRGHTITIFNDPCEPGVHEGIRFLPKTMFAPLEYRDVLIGFRGPHPEMTHGARYGVQIGWSADQFARSYYDRWEPLVAGMVGLSEFHLADHLARCAPEPNKMRIIGIGSDPAEFPDIPKRSYQFLYNSVPDRGLRYLADIWPTIYALYPEATLVITSDFRLWNGGSDPGNEEEKKLFESLPGVRLVGRVSRSELLRYELESEVHLYPCTYEELFCISNAEAQMAGCHAITSSVGALATTNFTGYQSSFHPNNPRFRNDVVNEVERFYRLPAAERAEKHAAIRRAAHERFSWREVCDQWEAYLSDLLARA